MKLRSTSKLAVALLCALAVAVLVPAGAQAEQGGLRCEELTFAVNLSPSDATVYNVFGVLCSRGSIENKTVQITLHGATYSHVYWDFPFQPETYSYMRRATAAGYAVLNLDRIGIGQSDHPPAAVVTIDANAHVVHQIVQQLRGGNLVVPAFGRVAADRVVLVGHSLGSVISIDEAATYGDVDGVVLTGVSHTVTDALGQILTSLYPANLDPRFADRNIPDGYLTSLPGLRGIFYYLPSADPLVIAIDDQTKETVTTAELDTAVPALFQSPAVHVPTFVIVGDFDAAFCAPPSCSASGSLAAEASFFPADACVETASIANAGHDLNLQFQAQEAYDAILSWMDRRVGSDTRVAPSDPCQR
ncbi:MAG TPA: alpha/beta fold hydrolase [Thermoanaerobaculia bacterium]|jgi:pimeloyl-ACP methyl ester carboxylesterase|nr:alpha/beta fold hydrolase [Thermoanaerobaculia bacterium]